MSVIVVAVTAVIVAVEIDIDIDIDVDSYRDIVVIINAAIIHNNTLPVGICLTRNRLKCLTQVFTLVIARYYNRN